jgi:hypothetical protein
VNLEKALPHGLVTLGQSKSCLAGLTLGAMQVTMLLGQQEHQKKKKKVGRWGGAFVGGSR